MRPLAAAVFHITALVFLHDPRESSAQIQPPVLIAPQNGDIIQLSAPPNQLNLQWGSVQSATEYLLIVQGPAPFDPPVEFSVQPPIAGNVSFNINNLSTGIYTWMVSSLNANESADSPPSFFTIQTGTVGGGDLPAPARLLPFEGQIIRGDSALVTFIWTRVQGAASYRLSITPPEGGFLSVPQPATGSRVSIPINLTSAQAGLYRWSVAALDAGMIAGATSPPQPFLFTPIDGEEWDLDESGAASPGDLFQLALFWQGELTAADLTGDGKTRADDAALIVEANLEGTLPSPTPIPGFTAPAQVRPVTNATVSTESVLFEWQRIIGALGYEFTLRDENPNSNLVQILPQGSAGTIQLVIPFLQARPRTWSVRALFGAGVEGPASPEIPFNVVE